MNSNQRNRLLSVLDSAISAGNEAIGKYGPEFQKNLAKEEMAELLVSLAREERGRESASDVREEIADVLITALELVCIYGIDDTTNIIGEKVQRLQERMKDDVLPRSITDVSTRVEESVLKERTRIVKYLKSVGDQFAIGDMVEQDDYISEAYFEAAEKIRSCHHFEIEST